ncbi:MAG TPA: hypothetical protein VJX23_14810 [Candidatus Binataceae bacterium]|nr:hypothetical protein [Candidatus Binataceae bacterium]
MRFAEHDEVVEGFAAYRSDEPLNVPVLPHRSGYQQADSATATEPGLQGVVERVKPYAVLGFMLI